MLNKEIFTWFPKLRFENLFSSIPSLRLMKGFRLSWVWQDFVEVEKNKSITIWVIPSILKVWQSRQICTKDLQKDELLNNVEGFLIQRYLNKTISTYIFGRFSKRQTKRQKLEDFTCFNRNLGSWKLIYKVSKNKYVNQNFFWVLEIDSGFPSIFLTLVKLRAPYDGIEWTNKIQISITVDEGSKVQI